MFRSTQFQAEFCTQSQATIVPRVTMTQFFLMILGAGAGAVVFNLPGYLIPIPVILGYIAGYTHNGELMFKRLRAWITVWGRQLLQRQINVSLEGQWKNANGSTSLHVKTKK